MKSPASNLAHIEGDHLHLFADSITDHALFMLSPDGFVNSWIAGSWQFKGYTPAKSLGSTSLNFKRRLQAPGWKTPCSPMYRAADRDGSGGWCKVRHRPERACWQHINDWASHLGAINTMTAGKLADAGQTADSVKNERSK